MSDASFLGLWVRRFLLEHLASERNLSPNTQKSYRDMLMQLLPFVAKKGGKTVDRLLVVDLSSTVVRQFLNHLELNRRCGISTRNQRLGGIHALAKFIGENRPEYVSWTGEIRQVPFKKFTVPAITCLDRAEMNALLEIPDRSTAPVAENMRFCSFYTTPELEPAKPQRLRLPTSTGTLAVCRY